MYICVGVGGWVSVEVYIYVVTCSYKEKYIPENGPYVAIVASTPVYIYTYKCVC